MGKLVFMTHTAPPKKVTNLEKRTREHLLPNEVEGMIKAASCVGRHGHRDSTLILLAYRHGLRVSELVALRWEQVDFSSGMIYVNRTLAWYQFNASVTSQRVEVAATTTTLISYFPLPVCF